MIAISLPEIYQDMIIKYGNIIKIGNSKGVIIPASILKELALNEKDEVHFSIEDGKMVIEKIPPFTGPFTGIFATLPRPKDGEADPWGDRDSAEIEEELRAGGGSREIPEW